MTEIIENGKKTNGYYTEYPFSVELFHKEDRNNHGNEENYRVAITAMGTNFTLPYGLKKQEAVELLERVKRGLEKKIDVIKAVHVKRDGLSGEVILLVDLYPFEVGFPMPLERADRLRNSVASFFGIGEESTE